MLNLKFSNKNIQQVSNFERIYYYYLSKHEINALHSLVEFAEAIRLEGFELDSIFNSDYDLCLTMYQRTGVASFMYLEVLYGEIIPIFLNGQWQGYIQAESPNELVLALHWVNTMNANADELYNKLLNLKIIDS